MTNSLISNIMDASQKKIDDVKIGDGVTFLHWTDRDPGTVAEIVTFKTGARAGQIKAIGVRADNYVITSGSEYDGSAQYEITPDPDARVIYATLRKNGKFETKGGTRVAVGYRDRHYDPSF
jgi:hypothetical protein